MFLYFWRIYLVLGANPMSHDFGLSFFLETRLKSASLEPLSDFLPCLEAELWLKSPVLTKVKKFQKGIICHFGPNFGQP